MWQEITCMLQRNHVNGACLVLPSKKVRHHLYTLIKIALARAWPFQNSARAQESHAQSQSHSVNHQDETSKCSSTPCACRFHVPLVTLSANSRSDSAWISSESHSRSQEQHAEASSGDVWVDPIHSASVIALRRGKVRARKTVDWDWEQCWLW